MSTPSSYGPRWIIVRDRKQIVGDVRATGRRKALAKLQRVFGGETHGTGGFYDALVGSEYGGTITVWKQRELEDPRLFNTPPVRARVRIVCIDAEEKRDA